MRARPRTAETAYEGSMRMKRLLRRLETAGASRSSRASAAPRWAPVTSVGKIDRRAARRLVTPAAEA